MMPTATTVSPEAYWAQFDIDGSDVDFILNLLLDREVPLTTAEMAEELVAQRLKRLEQEAQAAAEAEYASYLPKESYEVGQTLAFPALGGRIGKVVGVRPGENPDLGEFDVIQIEFEGDGDRREFAARLEDHALNAPPAPDLEERQLDTPQKVIERFGPRIEELLEARLEENQDTVRIAGRWFPRALVAEINEGHLNLAEAVLDVAGGGPLPTKDLLETIELPSNLSPQLAEFSLDYALQEDERFDEVGPAGQVLWYLRRLEPPEVQFTPPRLEWQGEIPDRSILTEELQALEARLDDEWALQGGPVEPSDEVTISLIFPHWRVGSLPLSPRLKPLFPTAYEAPRIRFILVDAHSGERFPGWVVREKGYVIGLEDWYRQYAVPVGGLVTIRPGEAPGEVVIETRDRRMRNDWIRTAAVDDRGEVIFTMLKQPVGTAYDDLMVVGVVDTQALDEAWMKRKRKDVPLERTVAHVFRELAKLTPQSAVHAQTLYAAVNVIERQPPAAVFAELISRPYFVHVGDLYWRFEASAWSGGE